MKLGTHKKRNELIQPWIKNKYVLDLGSMNHIGQPGFEKAHQTTDLFDFLKQNGKKVIGSDILPSTQPDIIQMDCQNINITYYQLPVVDVVMCGELIEHLDNPQAMLESVHKTLKDDGVLIITTPNSVSPWWYFARDNPNSEHVSWQSLGTLTQFLERNGYKVIQSDFYSRQTKSPLNWLFRQACKISPRLNLHLLVIAKKASS